MKNEKVNKIFDELEGIDVLYVNPRGEYFTSENLAQNSLEKGEKYSVVKRKDTKSKENEAKTE